MTTVLATGFDISSNQHPKSSTKLDFAAARKAGWSFAVVKATEGATYENPYFAGDVTAARAAGFSVDAYHWVAPTSSAAAQVANLLAVLAAAKFTPSSGRVWLDFEQSDATHALLDAVRAGIRAAGFETGTYTYPAFWKSNGSTSCAACASDPLWFAWSFAEEPTAAAVAARDYTIAPWQRVAVWQYAGTSATIPGLPGKNDANRLLVAIPLQSAPIGRYSMLVYAEGLDATTALAVCAARRVGVATTDLAEAKAAIARGDKVIVLGGPAAKNLGLTAPTNKPTTSGSATVAIGQAASDTLTLACQLIN